MSEQEFAERIREQLLRDEGERLAAYRDSEDLLTIGIGRCIDRVPFTPEEAEMCGCVGMEDYSTLEISREAAAFLFANDVQKYVSAVRHALPWSRQLDEARFGVLVNMAFNMGIGGLLGFKKFLASMKAGDWHNATLHMMNSKWAHQVGDRARRLREQVQTGRWC
jgi:lysozyme